MSDDKKPEVVATVVMKKIMGINVPVIQKTKEGPNKFCATLGTLLVGKEAAKKGGFYVEKDKPEEKSTKKLKASELVSEIESLSDDQKRILLTKLGNASTGGG
jgi:hypothetical protein